jgi:hypothetical protein
MTRKGTTAENYHIPKVEERRKRQEIRRRVNYHKPKVKERRK